LALRFRLGLTDVEEQNAHNQTRTRNKNRVRRAGISTLKSCVDAKISPRKTRPKNREAPVSRDI